MTSPKPLSFQKNLPFTKMHGLGNDFVMLHYRDVPVDADLSDLAVQLCDRQFGIGADGLIVVGAPPSDPAQYDLLFIYLNSDGSRAEMCGNGIRCLALFARDHGYVGKDEFAVETPAGLIRPRINPDRTVTVDMGLPILSAEKIPFKTSDAQYRADAAVQAYPLAVQDREIPVTLVSMGNPHCLVFQEDFAQPLDPAVYGPILEIHPAFPAKTNVEFLTVRDEKTLDVVVWERGCGFTLACGTGACASAVGAVLLGKTGSEVQVNLPGGPLEIRWDRDGSNHVFMTGPATCVFTGQMVMEESAVVTAL